MGAHLASCIDRNLSRIFSSPNFYEEKIEESAALNRLKYRFRTKVIIAQLLIQRTMKHFITILAILGLIAGLNAKSYSIAYYGTFKMIKILVLYYKYMPLILIYLNC